MAAKTSKKLEMLERLTAGGTKDPFHWYALAMEFRGLERHDEALQTFTALRSQDSAYLPMYLMCGQMLEKLSRTEEAREWYEAGMAVAKKKGETHALGELEAARAAL